jgi:hypothetical protein
MPYKCMGARRCSFTYSCSRHWSWVIGRLKAPVTSVRKTATVTYWRGSCVDHRSGPNSVKWDKSFNPAGNRIPVPQPFSLLAAQTEVFLLQMDLERNSFPFSCQVRYQDGPADSEAYERQSFLSEGYRPSAQPLNLDSRDVPSMPSHFCGTQLVWFLCQLSSGRVTLPGAYAPARIASWIK